MSPEQLEFKETARKFAREEIVPKAAEYDKTGEVITHSFFDQILLDLSILILKVFVMQGNALEKITMNFPLPDHAPSPTSG